eukprot:7234621-Pyramimonas_sp.AAC.1
MGQYLLGSRSIPGLRRRWRCFWGTMARFIKTSKWPYRKPEICFEEPLSKSETDWRCSQLRAPTSGSLGRSV